MRNYLDRSLLQPGSELVKVSSMDNELKDIKTFTLNEARSLIPKLRTILERVNKERDVLVKMNDELQRAREKADENGGTPLGVAYLKHITVFSQMVHKVQELGVLIKDFHSGLIDFPYEYKGRIVYLCWKRDEDDIDWWHEIEAGFAGRQLISEDFE